MRCKVMYRCVCARHCPVETDTQQGYQRAENRQTNLGSYSIPTDLMSLSHDRIHAITPYLGRLTQYVWSRNQGRVTPIHAADSVTFAERVRISKSRSAYKVHKSCEHCFVLRYSNVLHLHQRVCHKVGNTVVRTSRFALRKIFLPTLHLHHLVIRS